MKPLVRILLVESNLERRRKLREGLTASIISFEREDITLEVISCGGAAEALQKVTEDGDIQAVIVSWTRSVTGNFIGDLKAVRLEVPVYVLSEDERGLEIVQDNEDIESFFFLGDAMSDPEAVLGYIINDVDDRMKTPFWTAYRRYIVESNDSWHTPGHSGGTSFRNSPYLKDFYQFYGRNVFAGDLSVSVEQLGSLGDSSNVIGKAQEAAAYTFEVKRTYFITNGSSTANKMVLQTLLRRGDKVIVDRNCHKSVHYGVIQSAAWPVYLSSQLDQTYGFFAPPSLTDIRAAIEENPDAKLIVLTGCSYEGLLIDIRQVVEFAHARGIKVFIDEAWFGYSLFHPAFRRYSAINAGADYVTHSAHKVLSAFSQASFLHVNDPDFDPDFFREIYNIYTSTSPKYQLLASMDVCQKQMEMEGYKILNNLLRYVDELKRAIEPLENISILGPEDFAACFPHFVADNIGHDPLKILVDISKLPYPTAEIHRFLLDEVGIEVEKYTPTTLLVLLTIGGTRSKMIRLYNALKKLSSQRVQLNTSSTKTRQRQLPSMPPIKLELLPAEAFFSPREAVPLKDAVGRISAGLVTPYPPGIPMLVPGQRLEKRHIEFIRAIRAPKVVIQGLFDNELYVVIEDSAP
ncbi:MAG: arginine decarboxylase [Myxococcota bacterium]|jgi:arginine decarboxylase